MKTDLDRPGTVNHVVRWTTRYFRDWRRLAIVALLIATVGVMSLVRLIDGDEAFFLVAARLISEGLRPYHDFFFIHAPVLPYTFAGVFALFKPDWYVARVLSGLIAVGIGLILFDHLRRTTGKPLWAAVGAVLYAANGLVLGWFTVAKTLGLSAFFMLAGICLICRRGRYSSLLGGALLGLAASTRLYVGVALPCAMLFVIIDARRLRPAVREVAYLSAGAVVGMLPFILSFLRDREAFVFGTVEYHALRSGTAGMIGDWPQKWATLWSILGFETADGPESIQFLFLVIVAVAAGFFARKFRNSLCAYVWIALLVVSILPTPSYQQYFCLLIPFMIIEGVTLLAAADMPRIWPLVGMGLAWYVVLGSFEARRYTRTGINVPGIIESERVPRWSIPTVQEVSRAVDQQGLPAGGSWWPGYFVSARTAVAIDLANDFGMVVADQLTPERRRRFHIRSHDEITEMIRRHDPPLFVEGNWAWRASVNQLWGCGYRVSATIGPVKVWTFHK
jgi:hypothetical protein